VFLIEIVHVCLSPHSHMNNRISPFADLAGRVVIVTGAAAGIGLGLSYAFAEQGCQLVLLDVNETSLTEVAKRIEKSGTHVITVAGSVADPETVRHTCAEAVRQYGRIDVLINNAGVFSVYPSLELPLEEWKRVLDVNLTGVFLCAQEAAREMIRAKAGVILNIASAYGVVAAPKRAAYCATKAAVAMLTKVLAIEWARDGLRVNAIAPGYVQTDSVLQLAEQKKIDLESLRRRTPQGRLGTPEEIAQMAVFLASDLSAHITGQVIGVDGGWTAYGYI
jgi:NAD(P)-dependent dehydrogenase (short-subunit alcohol dehydrogenase family)